MSLPRTRTLSTVIVALLMVNATALTSGAFGAIGDTPGGDEHRLGVVGGQALADAFVPEPDWGDDPLAGITVTKPTDADLPVPDDPPRSAYAPTPEVVHGRLEIPAIGLSQNLYEGVTLTAINRGPSHWPGSAMPGEMGNVVVAGHRTTYSRPFWDLDLVQPGDELIFTTMSGRYVYEHVGTDIVSPTDLHILDQTRAHTATLFGCHPKGSARQRIVGHFELVTSEPNPAIIGGRAS